MFKLLMSVMFVAMIFVPNSYAYIDPGTGSMIIQGVVAAVVAGGVVIKMFWHKIKALFGAKPKNDTDDE